MPTTRDLKFVVDAAIDAWGQANAEPVDSLRQRKDAIELRLAELLTDSATRLAHENARLRERIKRQVAEIEKAHDALRRRNVTIEAYAARLGVLAELETVARRIHTAYAEQVKYGSVYFPFIAGRMHIMGCILDRLAKAKEETKP